MLNYSEGSSSGRPSPDMNPPPTTHGTGEEPMSMFFDFGTGTNRELQSGPLYQAGVHSSSDMSEIQDSAPRAGGIRVSLACIPVSGPLFFLERNRIFLKSGSEDVN